MSPEEAAAQSNAAVARMADALLPDEATKMLKRQMGACVPCAACCGLPLPRPAAPGAGSQVHAAAVAWRAGLAHTPGAGHASPPAAAAQPALATPARPPLCRRVQGRAAGEGPHQEHGARLFSDALQRGVCQERQLRGGHALVRLSLCGSWVQCSLCGACGGAAAAAAWLHPGAQLCLAVRLAPEWQRASAAPCMRRRRRRAPPTHPCRAPPWPLLCPAGGPTSCVR